VIGQHDVSPLLFVNETKADDPHSQSGTSPAEIPSRSILAFTDAASGCVAVKATAKP
jgi:hypothetical protein